MRMAGGKKKLTMNEWKTEGGGKKKLIVLASYEWSARRKR